MSKHTERAKELRSEVPVSSNCAQTVIIEGECSSFSCFLSCCMNYGFLLKRYVIWNICMAP